MLHHKKNKTDVKISVFLMLLGFWV